MEQSDLILEGQRSKVKVGGKVSALLNALLVMRTLVLTTIHLYTKFEVRSFSRSKDKNMGNLGG